MRPLKFIRPDLQVMQAYHVQSATGMVKLDAMENPYTLSPEGTTNCQFIKNFTLSRNRL